MLVRAIAGELVHRWLSRIPVTAALLVEEGRLASESPERVAKRGWLLARLNRTQQDSLVVDAPVRGRRQRRRAKEHGPCHSPSGGIPPVGAGVLAVQMERQ